MTEAVSTEYLRDIMGNARERTLELVRGLDGDQLMGPKLEIVNPLVWEIGHVAWFHEFFILRSLYDYPPFLANGDSLYDSIAIHHETRWDLPLLSLDDTLDYMSRVHDALLERLDGPVASEADSYIYQFATFHEDMHTEAFTYSRQTLGYPTPQFAEADGGPPADASAGALPGFVAVPGGTFELGTAPDAPFVFDNEKWAHPIEVAPFSIARAPVTNGEFAAFVDAGGYARREFWDDGGWAWREETGAGHPVYWVAGENGTWRVRRFDRVVDLAPNQPVVHVNWYEASAYCRWAGVRLPTEVEWEVAAAGEPTPDGSALGPRKRRYPWGGEDPDKTRANLDGRALGCIDVAALPGGDSAFGCRQMMGNVWEWTSTTLRPYPGFAPDAYKEYSQPLFGTTRVLRGGGWATRGRMVNANHRNFFGPDRRDVIAGFRTCKT